MIVDSKIGVVTSYPEGTGIYRFAENLFHLGIYSDFLYLKSTNARKNDEIAKTYKTIKPSFPLAKVCYPSSYIFKTSWLKSLKEYDYIHMVSPDFFHLSKFRNSIVGTIHDLYVLDPQNKYSYGELYRIFQKMDLNYCRNLLGVTTISHTTDDLLKKFYPNVKTKVIHHWTPDYFVKLDKKGCRNKFLFPKNKFILLNVSYKSFNKNMNFLSQLMDSLSDEFLLIHLGDSEISCVKQERVLNITRHLDDLTLVQLYNSADIYLAPSTSEGFNRPVIEALNCGVPVLASDIDIFREVLRFSPYLVPLDISDWRDAILSLTDHRELKAAAEWYTSNIGNYYREARGKEEFYQYFVDLGIKI